MLDKMLSTSLKTAMAETTNMPTDCELLTGNYYVAINSISCFETRDTSEKLILNCGVTAALFNSALARSESDDWPCSTHSIHR